MRKVAGSDTIIDRMITGDNEIIFNLISLIQSDANAVIITDDRSYIVAQTHSSTPVWVYLNENADARNSYSNAVYQKIGYMQIGQITEYAVSYGNKNKVEY